MLVENGIFPSHRPSRRGRNVIQDNAYVGVKVVKLRIIS
jgi:hypothetical protein